MDCILLYKTGTYTLGDNRVSDLFSASTKLINNFNYMQGVGIAPRYLLDCLQCSVIKVRCDLNNSNSGHCSTCCLHYWYLCLYFERLAQS